MNSLNKKQREHMVKWLDSKGVNTDCPACGSADCEPGDVIAAPALPGGGGTVIGGPTHPMVQMVCENCGHVRLFSSVAIGLPISESPTDEPLGIGDRT